MPDHPRQHPVLVPGGCRRRSEPQPEPTEQRTMEVVTMSTEIDQQEVRRLAATALRTAVQQRRDVAIGMAIYDRDELLPSTQDGFTTLHQAVGAEYDRLANTVARQEDDVRTVRAVVDAAGELPLEQFESMPDLREKLNALLEQFEDRINAVDEAESLARVRAFKAKLDEQADGQR